MPTQIPVCMHIYLKELWNLLCECLVVLYYILADRCVSGGTFSDFLYSATHYSTNNCNSVLLHYGIANHKYTMHNLIVIYCHLTWYCSNTGSVLACKMLIFLVIH